MKASARLSAITFDYSSWTMLILVWGLFAMISDQFFTWNNLLNVAVQSSSIAIVATGMTFVLLAGGVDLSVGAVMFLSAATAGKLATANVPFGWCVLAMLGVGLCIGMINANIVTRLGVVTFVATLGTMYVGRGVGLWITETRATPLPQSFLNFGSHRFLGLPLPILLAAAVIGVSQIILSYSSIGRHLIALGHDRHAAEKAGIATDRILRWVFAIAGLLASLGALVSLGQIGTVSPTFGENREFSAIAVAVIGGTSLFGGKGSIFPGVVIGALLLQSVESGLVMANADPYLYPIAISMIIFAAVLLDGVRNSILAHRRRRPIFIG